MELTVSYHPVTPYSLMIITSPSSRDPRVPTSDPTITPALAHAFAALHSLWSLWSALLRLMNKFAVRPCSFFGGSCCVCVLHRIFSPAGSKLVRFAQRQAGRRSVRRPAPPGSAHAPPRGRHDPELAERRLLQKASSPYSARECVPASLLHCDGLKEGRFLFTFGTVAALTPDWVTENQRRK